MGGPRILLSLLAASAAASSPPPLACSSPADCSYNGACVGGACACAAPWAGAGCDELCLAPLTDASAQLGYQWRNASAGGGPVSSWGGSVVGPDASGTYHMYAAEMSLGCGINTWLSNSIVVHATSPDPLSTPFARRSVVQAAFAHEPIAARAPTGEWVVYFTAVLPSGELPVKGGEPCLGCADGVSVAGCGTDANRNASVNLPTYMVYSTDPDGVDPPWSAPQMVPGTDVYADSNFAPWINADGSLVALTRGQVYRAADWRNISQYRAVGGWKDHGEDPFIWRNEADGVYHGIIHVGRPNTYGLHMFSTDGGSWTPSTGRAYSSVLEWANGSSLNVACRERPHVVHDAAGKLIALTNGLAVHSCHQAGADDHSVTFLQGMSA